MDALPGCVEDVIITDQPLLLVKLYKTVYCAVVRQQHACILPPHPNKLEYMEIQSVSGQAHIRRKCNLFRNRTFFINLIFHIHHK